MQASPHRKSYSTYNTKNANGKCEGSSYKGNLTVISEVVTENGC